MALLFPLVTQPMFDTLTYKWALTLWGFLALMMAPTPFVRPLSPPFVSLSYPWLMVIVGIVLLWIQDTCAQHRLPPDPGYGRTYVALFLRVVVRAITSRIGQGLKSGNQNQSLGQYIVVVCEYTQDWIGGCKL